MTSTSAPPAPAASPPPAPAPRSVVSLTDPATWVSTLSIVAAVILNVWHRDVSAYVPVASVGVAGLVVTGTLVAKHRYAAALDAVVALVDRLEATPTATNLRYRLAGLPSPNSPQTPPGAPEAPATAAAPPAAAPEAPGASETADTGRVESASSSEVAPGLTAGSGPPGVAPPPLSLAELVRLLRAAGYHIEDPEPTLRAGTSAPAPPGPPLPPLIPQGGTSITTGPAHG